MTSQASVIQWNVAKWELEGSSIPPHARHTVIGEQVKKDGNDEIVVIPIEQNVDLESTDSEYLDVRIQMEPDKRQQSPNLITTACATEYLNVRIHVEPERQTVAQNGLKRIRQRSNLLSKEKKKKEGKPISLDDRPFQCKTCSKGFVTKQHLERHSNLHSMETLYPCQKCDKVLLDKSYLIRHMRVHDELKAFTCSICQKKLYSASSMKRHTTTHDPTLRPCYCPDCGKRFPNNSSLKKHSLTHSGVKAYICTICAKCFSYVGDLNTHLRSHDSVKNFQCNECGKEFSKHNNLIRHKMVHVSDSKYKCSICKVCFQHASTLTRHVLASHPETARVKRRHVSHTKSQELKSMAPEGEDHNGTRNNVGNQESVSEAHAIPFKYSDGSVQNNSSENEHGSLNQIELIRSSPSSFQIYEFDATGTLVEITDTVSLQSTSQRDGLG